VTTIHFYNQSHLKALYIYRFYTTATETRISNNMPV